MNIFKRRFIELIKPVSDGIGLGSLMRQAYVETLLLGERAKFGLNGYPKTDTTIFLAGSGRSGTTWITNVLCSLPGVQQVFEPLFPIWNETVRDITGWDVSNPYFRAVYLRETENYPEWEKLWRNILTGRYRNYWTDYERNSCFPDRFLIKEIRANMMLGYLHRHFQPRIVYVLRHPCAVVYSRLAVPQPWHADVQDILGQEKLVDDHLQPLVSVIEQETDLVGAHAVWWAVENYVALHQLRSVPHFLVFFEDLVSRPSEVLETLLPWLGVEKIPEKVLSLLPRPSRMSNEKLEYQDSHDRLSHWQNSLSVDDQKRVLSWAERLGLDMYNATSPPTLRSSAYAP